MRSQKPEAPECIPIKILIMDYLFKNETHKIIGCCMAVHNELGYGFYEPVYHEAVAIEFLKAEIPYKKEVAMTITYKGNDLSKQYFADFLCFNEIIVELKAVNTLTDMHMSQVINYLKASKNRIGLLINFGAPSLEFKRIIV